MSEQASNNNLDQPPLAGFGTPSSHVRGNVRRRIVAQTLSQIQQLHERLNNQLYTNPVQRPAVNSPSDAARLFSHFIGCLDHEELWVMAVDTRNRVLQLTQLYKGTVNSSQIRVAEVFRQAVLDNAPAILIGHNHPSGDATPSPEDVAVTRTIVRAGKLLEISVLDHIIVGKEAFVSLKEKGLGFDG